MKSGLSTVEGQQNEASIARFPVSPISIFLPNTESCMLQVSRWYYNGIRLRPPEDTLQHVELVSG
jgi:hypothetical protein